MKYNTFIFDFDFTLADATQGIVESVNFALVKLRIEPKSCDDIRKTVGMSLRDTFFVLTSMNDDTMVKSFIEHFKVKADEVMTLNTILFSDTVPMLRELKRQNFNTAIVTSKFNYRIVEILEKYYISHLIDCIIGFEDVKEPKPSPEGLLKAVHILSSSPENVLFIGDSLIDANTALNANIDFAAVTTGTTCKQDFERYPNIAISSSLSQLFT